MKCCSPTANNLKRKASLLDVLETKVPNNEQQHRHYSLAPASSKPMVRVDSRENKSLFLLRQTLPPPPHTKSNQPRPSKDTTRPSLIGNKTIQRPMKNTRSSRGHWCCPNRCERTNWPLLLQLHRIPSVTPAATTQAALTGFVHQDHPATNRRAAGLPRCTTRRQGGRREHRVLSSYLQTNDGRNSSSQTSTTTATTTTHRR